MRVNSKESKNEKTEAGRRRRKGEGKNAKEGRRISEEAPRSV